MEKTKSRIYVCHTFYHVYVSLLKEMKIIRETLPSSYQKADIALSAISTNFENLGERLRRTGIFGEIFMLDEKREDFFPELAKYRANYSNVVKHLVNRIIFTKKLAKCEVPYMEIIDFKAYEAIYVFCDSDPIG
ncbi:MAG: lipooligosaccharide sialyltransferase, partial [Lachnospiraceae bacterium]|nr:lipooligosaccharide sialyltransferase [Lachnospiraceae bacterium]